MNTQKLFTKIDVLITVLCLVLLAVNLPVISSSGRTHAKMDVCMANLRQLTAAWNLYADENADKIAGTFMTTSICVFSSIYPSMNCDVNPPVPSTALNDIPPIKHHSFPSWVELPHQWDITKEPSAGSKSDPHHYGHYPNGTAINSPWNFPNNYLNKERDDRHAIACGTFWKYIKDYKVYRCPAGDKGIAVTYDGSDAMNGIHNQGVGSWCNMYPSGSWKLPSFYIRAQIPTPAEYIVFLDVGQQGISWNLRNTPTAMTQGCWSSTPPVRHNNGATFSFADGHVEYHKWNGEALTWVQNGCTYSKCGDWGCYANCSKDLFYMAKHVCGSIGGMANEAAIIAALQASGCDIE